MGTERFQEAGVFHYRWMKQMKAFLDYNEELDEQLACILSDKECALGKWLNKEMSVLKGNKASGNLEVAHKQLHVHAKEMVRLKQAGDVSGATACFAQMEPLSKNIVTLLTTLDLDSRQ